MSTAGSGFGDDYFNPHIQPHFRETSPYEDSSNKSNENKYKEDSLLPPEQDQYINNAKGSPLMTEFKKRIPSPTEEQSPNQTKTMVANRANVCTPIDDSLLTDDDENTSPMQYSHSHMLTTWAVDLNSTSHRYPSITRKVDSNVITWDAYKVQKIIQKRNLKRQVGLM